MTVPTADHEQYVHLVSLHEADPEDCNLFGNKAASLARMMQAGVPVPEGYVLTTEAFDIAREQDTIPESYVAEVMRVIGELGDVAIRSSATVEDTDGLSLAGVFETSYVTDRNPDTVTGVITDIYAQAISADVVRLVETYGISVSDIKLGLIIQRLIHPDFAGVMYYPEESDDVVLEYVAGFARKLVDGEQEGATLLLSKERSLIKASSGFDDNPMPKPIVNQLLEYGQKVVDIFEERGQDVEFTTSKEGLHIVQARPLTRELGHMTFKPTVDGMVGRVRERAHNLMTGEMAKFNTDKSVLHLNNFAELLPDPAPMDIGIFQSVFTGLDDQEGAIQLSRRRMGYPDTVSSLGYMHYLGGKAYESLAGDAGSFYVGFPPSEQEYLTTLVTDYLDTVYADPAKAAYPQMGLYLRHPSITDLATRFGDARAAEYMDTYLAHRSGLDVVADNFLAGLSELEAEYEGFMAEELARDPETLDDSELLEAYDYALQHLRTRSAIDFDTAAHLALYYTQLLEQKVAAHPAVGTERIGSVLSVLAQGLEGSAVTAANMAIWSAPDADVAYSTATKLVGHYQVEGEVMEIRQPRFIDSPEALRHYVDALRSGDNYREVFEGQRLERISQQDELLSGLDDETRRDFTDIMTRMQRFQSLRETLKDRLTKEYVPLRNYLIEIGSRSGLEDEEVFYVYPHEIQSLMEDHASVRHLINARKVEHDLERKLSMPRVLRHDTVGDISSKSAHAEAFTEADGQLIAAGRPVQGIVVNLDQMGDYTEAMRLVDSLRADGYSVIIAASIINLTHDPYLNKAEGLVLENAGFVSHGAQRARELGIGALSGIDTARLRTGMRVLFDPESGIVQNLNEKKQ